jgi:hypothetical protein
VRGGVSYQLSRHNGGKMLAVKLLHQQSESNTGVTGNFVLPLTIILYIHKLQH